MTPRKAAVGARDSKQALGSIRKLATTVHAYRRVRHSVEAMPPDLRYAFEAIAVRRLTPRKFATESRLTLDTARGRIAAAFAWLNGDLGLPTATELVS